MKNDYCSIPAMSRCARAAVARIALFAAAALLCVPMVARAQCETKWRVFPAVGVQTRVIALHNDGLTNDVYIGNGNAVYRWTSSGWQQLGGEFDSLVKHLVSYNGELYAGGQFNTYNGNTLYGLAKWNGTDWVAASTELVGYVFGMAVIDDKLYVGGNASAAGPGGAKGIYIWDGNTWSGTPFDFTFSPNAFFSAFGKYQGDLIVGGNFYWNGTTAVKSVARLHNGVFQPMGDGLYWAGGSVLSFAEYNNELYAAGQWEAGSGAPARNIARWDGANWQPLNGGTNTPVFKILVQDGKLVACGQFNNAGGVTVNGLATWDGANWADGGTPFLNHDVQTMAFGPSDELLLGGQMIYDPLGDNNFDQYPLARRAEGKPLIYTQPFGGTYCNGANFLLFAQAFTDVASGELTWSWSKDAEPLEDGPTDHYSEIAGAHTNSPVILHARAADSGYYQGVAYNSCGFSLTYTALVYICASDLNCDGVSDLGDFFDFFNAWDTTDIHADVDGDGQVDLLDFFAFFNGFDAQC